MKVFYVYLLGVVFVIFYGHQLKAQGVVFNNTLPDNAVNGDIIIYDLMGRVMKTFSLQKGYNTVNVSAIDYTNGIYIYTMRVDGKRIANQKLVVIK